jgi:hypothetical protein
MKANFIKSNKPQRAKSKYTEFNDLEYSRQLERSNQRKAKQDQRLIYWENC